MRIDIKKTKVYPFDELSEEAKETAVEKLWDINVNYEWWNSVYDDAENVGIKIVEFDIGRGNFCRGHFTNSAEDVAKAIIANHGDTCETYKTAESFLAEYYEKKAGHETDLDAMSPDETPLHEEFEDTGLYGDMVNEFQHFILEDYRILLTKEYEYLSSEETIIDTIKTNDYEFTEDGELYS